MLVFALDTSTLQGSIGWVEHKQNGTTWSVEGFAECHAPAKPGHAETVLQRIGHILSYGGYGTADLDLLVIGTGPGTFTGLRIGLSTIKGLALANGIPVVGMSSLKALALSVERAGPVATLVDARRNEIYGALYQTEIRHGRPHTELLLEERVGPIHDIVDGIERTALSSAIAFAGNGVAPYKQQIVERFGSRAVFLPETHVAPSAFWMARSGHAHFVKAGADDLDTIVPVYLREPDARLPGSKAQKRPT